MTVDVPFNVIEDALIHRASKPDKSEQTAAAFTSEWDNGLRVADASRFGKPLTFSESNSNSRSF